VILLLTLACSHESQLTEQDVPPTPAIALTSPLAATWHAEGETPVTGTWEHVDTITVNDVPAALEDDGTFSTILSLDRGLNTLEAVGQGTEASTFDRVGVLAGSWEDPGQAIADAISLRLNEDGIDQATDYAAGMVTEDLVNESVTAMNPVYQDSYGLWGWDAVEVYGDIDEITFSQARIDATPGDGVLELEITIPDLFVDLQAYGEVIGIDFDTDASMTSTKAVITGTMLLGVDGAGGLTVDLTDPTVELKGFDYDTSLLPWDIEDYLFVDSIRGVVEDMLLEKIKALVPPLLEDLLSGLDLSMELDLMGAALSVSVDFTAATIDSDGVALSTSVEASVPMVGTKVYPGFLGSAPVSPALSTRAPVSGAISDDLVNLMLFQAWRGGVLDRTMSTEDGSLDPLMLLPLKAEEGSIQLTANLPPVAVEVDGGLQLQVGELIVDIHSPGGELGEYLQVAVSVYIDLDITLVDGVAALELGEPTLSMMVLHSDWGASSETTTRLIEEMLPIDSFMMLLGGLEFPLPALAGLTLEGADIGRDAGTGLHTSMEIQIGL
jgi:hypothetical protein